MRTGLQHAVGALAIFLPLAGLAFLPPPVQADKETAAVKYPIVEKMTHAGTSRPSPTARSSSR